MSLLVWNRGGRQKPVDINTLVGFFDGKGVLKDYLSFQIAVASGGLENSIRKDGWKFLFHYYNETMTTSERMKLDRGHAESYRVLKNNWMRKTPKETFRNTIKYRYLHVDEIEGYVNCMKESYDLKSLDSDKINQKTDDIMTLIKDVPRTRYYGGENGRLHHECSVAGILISFVTSSLTHSYIQGMSDIASCFLEVMMNEDEAYRMFCRFYDDFGEIYAEHGLVNKCASLRYILRTVDPDLYKVFQQNEMTDMGCCLRMLMTFFLRELSNRDECFQAFEMACARTYISLLMPLSIEDHNLLSYDMFICIALLRYRFKNIRGAKLASLLSTNELQLSPYALLRLADDLYLLFHKKWMIQTRRKSFT